jgi:hypothetical protein
MAFMLLELQGHDAAGRRHVVGLAPGAGAIAIVHRCASEMILPRLARPGPWFFETMCLARLDFPCSGPSPVARPTRCIPSGLPLTTSRTPGRGSTRHAASLVRKMSGANLSEGARLILHHCILQKLAPGLERTRCRCGPVASAGMSSRRRTAVLIALPAAGRRVGDTAEQREAAGVSARTSRVGERVEHSTTSS